MCSGELVRRADAVFFPVDCVSYRAVGAVKSLCEEPWNSLLSVAQRGAHRLSNGRSRRSARARDTLDELWSPAVGEGRIEVLRLDFDLAAPWPDADWNVLNTEERGRLALFRHEDRLRMVSTRAALRRLLGEKIGADPATLRFTAGRYGRPESAGRRRLLQCLAFRRLRAHRLLAALGSSAST